MQKGKNDCDGTSSSSSTMHLSASENAHFCEMYSDGSQPKLRSWYICLTSHSQSMSATTSRHAMMPSMSRSPRGPSW